MVRFIDVAVLVLLQIALKFERGEAIQCFVCNSKSDPRCADPIQTDWQGPDEQDSDDSNESSEGGLEPIECYLANRYTKGIQAVSDLVFRGYGHPRLGVPDLWATTAATLSASGGNRGPNKGYRGSSWASYGGQREEEEATGCHKVVYTDNNGDSVVDRGCAKERVANTDPCSALDSATSNNDNGYNSGNTGSSGYGGHGGGNSGGGNGGAFDLSQISVDFCEVCNDNDGCNRATNLSINSLFILVLSITNISLKFV